MAFGVFVRWGPRPPPLQGGSTYPGVAAEPGRRAEGHHGQERHDLQPPHVELRVPRGIAGQAPSCRGQGAE